NSLLIAAEYYFDVDPGIGSATPLSIPNAFQVNEDFDITLPALSDGMHIMYVRVQNEQEIWSEIAEDTLYICDITMPTVVSTGNNCTGGTVTLNAGIGYDAYNWSTGSNQQTTTVTQSGIYTVTVFSGACSVTISDTIDFVEIQTPQITVGGSLCEGTTATLDAGSGYDTYQWSTSGNGQTTSITEGGTYSVIVTIDGCIASASEEIDFIPTPAPAIEIVGSLCTGNIITLDAGSGYSSYSWNGGAQTQNIPVNQNGTYSVIVYVGDCFGSDSQNVTFISLPVPDINQNVNVLTCDETGYSYQWYFEGVAIDGATSISYNATQSGTYSVMILDGDCSEESDDLEFIYNGIEEAEFTFNLYPNPTNEAIVIEVNGVLEYTISDETGRQITIGTARNKTIIPTGSLASGVYLIKLGEVNKRFVVQH
ncbi:MAG: T9SS type A sorting domain-containing protein, partial [Flavobacteriales bacterium]